jgi:hypothetical protein
VSSVSPAGGPRPNGNRADAIEPFPENPVALVAATPHDIELVAMPLDTILP